MKTIILKVITMTLNQKNDEKLLRAQVESVPGNKGIMAALVQGLADIVNRSLRLDEIMDVEDILLQAGAELATEPEYLKQDENQFSEKLQQTLVKSFLNVRIHDFEKNPQRRSLIWKQFCDAEFGSAVKITASTATLNIALNCNR